MQTLLLLLSAIIIYVEAICNSTQYWNPLNNACVNCNNLLIQNAHGNHPISTTEILLPVNASPSAQPRPAITPTTSHKYASKVNNI